ERKFRRSRDIGTLHAGCSGRSAARRTNRARTRQKGTGMRAYMREVPVSYLTYLIVPQCLLLFTPASAWRKSVRPIRNQKYRSSTQEKFQARPPARALHRPRLRRARRGNTPADPWRPDTFLNGTMMI